MILHAPPRNDTPAVVQPDHARNAIAPLQFVVSVLPDHNIVHASNRTNASLYIWLIGLMVILVPVPYGSHRSMPWAIWAVVASIMMIGFVTRQNNHTYHIQTQSGILALAALLPLFSAGQLLPLGHLFDGAFPPDAAPKTLTLSPSATLLAILRLTTYAMLFILTFEVCSRPRHARKLAQIIFYGVTLHAVVAMIFLSVMGDRSIWGEKTAYLGWATGPFVNRNSFASFMGLGIVIGIGLVFTPQKHRRADPRILPRQKRSRADARTIANAVCLALLCTALIASGSRMGTAATIIGACVTYAAMAIGDTPKVRITWRQLIGAVGILTMFTLLLMSRDIGARLLFFIPDLNIRLDLYANIWDLISTRPWVGYGLDTFQVAFPLVHDQRASPAVVWDLAHNSYLTLWAEVGLIAGTAPMIALAWAGVRLMRGVRRAARSEFAPAIALGTLAMAATHSLVDFSFEVQANTLLLVVIIAMGLSLSNRYPMELR